MKKGDKVRNKANKYRTGIVVETEVRVSLRPAAIILMIQVIENDKYGRLWEPASKWEVIEEGEHGQQPSD